MIETILAILLTPWALLSLAVIAVLFDHNRHEGTSSFLLVLMFTLGYFLFDPSLAQIGYTAGSWILIGILYSFVRWSFHCNRIVKQYDNGSVEGHYAIHQTSLASQKPRITYWAFAWPISFVATILSDAITWLGKLLHFVFGNAFRWVSQRSQGRIAKIARERGEKY